MDKIYLDPQLESEFSHLINRYDLSDILYLLNRYLEGRTKLASELKAQDVAHWYNLSGYCRMMAGELEQITTVYKE